MSRRSVYLRRRRRQDALAVLGGVAFLLLIVAFIALSVWIHFFASCGHIGWLPAKEMPARCYSFVRH
jgi:hypothetical protein